MAGLSADWRKFETFDGFRRGLIGHLRPYWKEVSPQWKKMQGPNCMKMDIIVAGWSETTGPDSYLLRTMKGTPTPAWSIIDTGNVLLTPSSDAIYSANCDRLVGPRAAEELEESEIIRVAELQRLYRDHQSSRHSLAQRCNVRPDGPANRSCGRTVRQAPARGHRRNSAPVENAR